MKNGPVSIFVMERTESGYSLTSSIDNYETLTFTQSFFNVGSFSFSMLADSPQAKYVNVDSFVVISDNFGGATPLIGVIQTVDRAIDEGSKKILRADGLEASCILSYRMVDPGSSAARYTSTGTFEAAIKALVNSQCGATVTDANRAFPGFTVAPSAGRGPSYTFNERWSNLSEAVQKGCIAAEVGYRISWSGSGLVFDTIHGLDRTLGNGVNNPAVFSTDFDTVRESHFTLSRSNYKNYAYAGGQGVGTARVIQPVYSTDSTPTGYKRREIFVDARDLSATADLTTRGNQALDEYQYESFVEATINPFATFAQSSGATLGDLVTVQSFGMEAECRITGISEQWSEAGYDCSFTMDRQLPNVQSIANAESYKAARANTYAEKDIDADRMFHVCGAARFDGTNWTLIDDADHTPLNIESITDISGGGFRITYSKAATEVRTLVATPDEAYARWGMGSGASVGLTYSDVYVCGRHITKTPSTYMAFWFRRSSSVYGYVYYNGSTWTSSDSAGITGYSFYSPTGELTINHSDAGLSEVTITSRSEDAYYLTQWSSYSSTQTLVKFIKTGIIPNVSAYHPAGSNVWIDGWFLE